MPTTRRRRWLVAVALLVTALASPAVGQPPPAPAVMESDTRPPRVEPLPVSQQSPFTIPPGSATAAADAPPAAGNDRNSFEGFFSNQDLSRLLPGNFKDTRYKWYGFVRVDGIYDVRPIASTDSFVTSSIPVPQGRGKNVVVTPRYTRLGFDTETPYADLAWTLKTRIELDFFSGNTSGAFGSYPLRLRFAWADFGPFRVGQDASVFMDYDTFPNVLDYQGPPGMILMRQALASVRFPLGDKVRLAFGVEQPVSDLTWQDTDDRSSSPGSGIISTAGVGRSVQAMPDFTGHLRYEGDYGHARRPAPPGC